MRTRVARWLAALGLAVAYFATARLGLALALPPDYKATAVWAPSGIALAFVLLFGSRMGAGVWAGAFAANVWGALAPNPSGVLTAHLISSAVIATGSTLQALAGAVLIRRFIGPRGALECARDAFRFVTIIPAACLIAATAGALALGATGLVPWAAVPTRWWAWWVGDTVDALVVAPVVLCAVRCEPFRRPTTEAVVLFALLLGSCAFVFGGWWLSGVPTAPLAYL
ncbi:MAG TPA: MASE1 domain-containing protein, partial [Gemmata sp.]